MLKRIEAGDILPLIASGKLKIEEFGLSFEDILSLIVGSEVEGEIKLSEGKGGKEGIEVPGTEPMRTPAIVSAT
ncbi:MAG: hypothetical protein Q9N34_07240 [Aquificota bacterium]|nr:hypothetical protein [Aquificota bacterium]